MRSSPVEGFQPVRSSVHFAKLVNSQSRSNNGKLDDRTVNKDHFFSNIRPKTFRLKGCKFPSEVDLEDREASSRFSALA